MEYSGDGAVVRDATSGDVMFTARLDKPSGLYVVDAFSAEVNAAHSGKIIHARLAHQSAGSIDSLAAAKATVGLHIRAGDAESKTCQGCVEGKAHRAPFGKKMNERATATAPLQCVHADLCGPIFPSVNGAKYMLTIVDEHSRYTKIIPLKNKSDVCVPLMKVLDELSASTGCALREFHSDNGGEFVNEVFKAYCDRKGVCDRG